MFLILHAVCVLYWQGNLALKDFDIQKEAGGSFRAVVKDFNARVTENHLEIHLFWAGKGTCCVPAQGIYGPSISAISVSPGGIHLYICPLKVCCLTEFWSLILKIIIII